MDKRFLEIHINKSNLLCYTVNGNLYQTNNMIEHIPESYGWSVDTKFYIKDLDDIEKYWEVIQDSYNNSK